MNKMRQWAALTAVTCLAVLAAGWFVVVKPQRAHATSLRNQAASTRADNDRLLSKVNQLKQQQKDLPAQQKQLAAIATKIPDNPALPSLIRQLSAAADGAGVNLMTLAPSAPSPALQSSLGQAAKAPVKPGVHVAPSPLAQIPIAIQVRGSYFNIVQFFSAVESLSRSMLVTGFTLTPAGGGTGATPTSGVTSNAVVDPNAPPPGSLNAEINATVFEAAQTAPAAVQPSTTTTVH